MIQFILLFCGFCATIQLAAQSLKGYVITYPEERPLSGVNLSADGKIARSQSDGGFWFRGMRGAGEEINIAFTTSEDYKPAYSRYPVSATLRTDDTAERNPFRLVLCLRGNCPADQIIKRGKANLNQQLNDISQKIDELPAGSQQRAMLEDSIATLVQRLTEKETLLREISEQVVRTRFNNTDPLVEKAISYLEAFQPDSAIWVLQKAKVTEDLKAILDEEAKLQAKQAALAEEKAKKITAQMTLARSFALEYQLDSAIAAYEIAILADTTQHENVYDYAEFLKDIKAYKKAIYWLTKVTQNDEEVWRQGNAFLMIGDLYKELGDFDAATNAFEKYREVCQRDYSKQYAEDYYKNTLAISYERIGTMYQAQGKFDSALVYFVERSRLGKELYADNPKSESLKNGLAISY
ncbi:MAG: hypothetical protein AAGI49_11310, partial [Bacteroidota bacterium]